MLIIRNTVLVLAIVVSAACCLARDPPKKQNKKLSESVDALDKWIYQKFYANKVGEIVVVSPEAMMDAAKKALEKPKLMGPNLQPAYDVLATVFGAQGKCDAEVIKAMSDFMNLDYEEILSKQNEPVIMFKNSVKKLIGPQCNQFFIEQYETLAKGFSERPEILNELYKLHEADGKSKTGQSFDWYLCEPKMNSNHFWNPLEEPLREISALAKDDERYVTFKRLKPSLFTMPAMTSSDYRKAKTSLKPLYEEFLYKPCQALEEHFEPLFSAFKAYLKAFLVESDKYGSQIDILAFMKTLPDQFKVDYYHHSICKKVIGIYEYIFDKYFEHVFLPPPPPRDFIKSRRAGRYRASEKKDACNGPWACVGIAFLAG